MNCEQSFKLKKAVMLGTMCSFAYLAVYLARNILSAVSPQMIECGVLSTEFIGSLSSVFFISYAIGQLINGAIGDRVKAKYMISLGLVGAGLCCFLFVVFSYKQTVVRAIYAVTGFCLSMVYAPMVKTVAENTEPHYATRCSLGFTFASFFGSPLAGFMAGFLLWQTVFNISSIALAVMGAVCFTCFWTLEKRGIISYRRYNAEAENNQGIAILLKHRIIKFTMISVITGVVRTSVVFWMPTYISQYLGFTSAQAAKIFTAATLVISFTPFVAVFIYEKLNRNMDKVIFLAFCSAATWFVPVYLIKQPTMNVAFLVLAIMSSNAAASMLWSRYCPSLRDTGMVSTATGFLDFMSYSAAAVSSTLFANAVSKIGWNNLILTWFALMTAGILVALPGRNKEKNDKGSAFTKPLKLFEKR